MDAWEPIHRFTGARIPRADVETIIDAGRLAATGSHLQLWDFVVVPEPTVLHWEQY